MYGMYRSQEELEDSGLNGLMHPTLPDRIERSYLLVIKTGKSPTRKTVIYTVYSQSGAKLGQIKWWPTWRKYVFLTVADELVFDDKCLEAMRSILKELNDKHRGRI